MYGPRSVVGSVPQLSGLSAAVVIAASFSGGYVIDRLTATDLNLFPLYLIPIGLALYSFGASSAYGACLIAVLASLSAELHAGLNYTHPWILFQAMAARGLVFLLITYLVSLYSHALATSQARLNQIKSVLPVCANCGQILCHDSLWRSLEQVVHNPKLISSLPDHPCLHAPQDSSPYSDC